MSNPKYEVQKKEDVKNLGILLNRFEADFLETSNVTEERFKQEIHFAMQAMMANDFLFSAAKANPQSLKNAIINIAATGLTLNPIKKEAYLIPRKINKQLAITLDISYLGMYKTGTDTKSILYLICEIVREKDLFVMNKVGEAPEHKFSPFKDRGEIVGCYVTAKTFEGDYLTCIMDIGEILEIRKTSEAFKKGFGPWINFYTEMIKKTVIKRAYKLWPRTEKFHLIEKVVDIANEQEGIDFKEEKTTQQMADEDFPRKPEDCEKGPDYLVIKGKFRDKRLKDIDLFELEEYMENYLIKGREKGKYTSNDWVETYSMIKDWIDNQKAYMDIANEDD